MDGQPRAMRYISLFSGIEAASLAWEDLGFKPVAFSEIEPFPCAVLAHRFPEVPNLGDITKVDWSDYADKGIDIIVGGSPCQSFSVAGRREGLAGASGLMFEYLRAVQEVMPRWVVWENVPGALSSEGGAAFGQLLGELDALGYGLAWRVLDAQFFGVAQRRQRLFVVGSLGEAGAERACEVLFEPDSLQWDPTPSREKRKELAARAAGSAGGASEPAIPINTMIATRGGKLGRGTDFGVAEDGDPAYTITATHPHAVCTGFKFHAGSSAGSIAYQHEQSPTITADWHSPAVLCMTDTQPNTMVADGLCGTLSCHSKKDPPVVCRTDERVGWTSEIEGPVAFAQNTRDEVRYVNGLHSAAASPSAGKVIATEEPRSAAIAIDRATTPKFSEELCHTLRRGGAGGCNDAVAVISQYGEVAGTLTARYDSSPCPDRGQNIVNAGSVVRRLTPRECERLQGMPDHWTRIPYRGKPADQCPDGPRYKAIGNSMAVPVMRWIGEGIVLVDKLEGRCE